MALPLERKSTVDDIRKRFDKDVERFSNLETAHAATIDAPLAMELITKAALSCTPTVKTVLDIGCGGGNNTLKLLQLANNLNCDLIDLSQPMLKRAYERITPATTGKVRTMQGDFRTLELPDETYDVVLAAAVLHHLRDDRDWENTFKKIYRITAPGGSVWITDLIAHESEPVQNMMWNRYGDYLVTLGGENYKNKQFANIEKEDTPRPVTYQLELLRQVGFVHVELLHKNSCFAAFGAIKGR